MQTRSIVSEDDLLFEADYLATGQPGDLIFRSGGVERARILSNGAATGLLTQDATPTGQYRLASATSIGATAITLAQPTPLVPPVGDTIIVDAFSTNAEAVVCSGAAGVVLTVPALTKAHSANALVLWIADGRFLISYWGAVKGNSTIPADMDTNRKAVLAAIDATTANGGAVTVPIGQFRVRAITASLSAGMGGSTTLNGGITSGDTTIALTSTAGLSSPVTVLIESEYVTGTVSGSSLVSCTRGAFGSAAAAHLTGAFVADAQVVVASTDGFSSSGVLRVGTEEMFYSSKTATTFRIARNATNHQSLPNRAARGYRSTTVASHAAAATVVGVTLYETKNTLQFRGCSSPWENGVARVKSSIVVDDSTTDLFTFPVESGSPTGFEVRDMMFSYGRDFMLIPTQGHGWLLDNVIWNGAGSFINCLGSSEQSVAQRLYTYPGTNSIRFRPECVQNGGASHYWDKTHIDQWVSGGALSSIDIQTTFIDSVVVKNFTSNTAQQHGIIIDAAARGLTFVGLNDEGTGTSGKSDVTTTTATTTAGATSVQVASSTGYANGDSITISEAGTIGKDHYSTVTGVPDGTHINFADATISTVAAGARATDAVWDGLVLKGGAYVAFVGGTFGFVSGGAGPSHGRYGVNTEGAYGVSFFGSDCSGVVYDPGWIASKHGGNVTIRQPANNTFGVTQLNGGATYKEAKKTTVPSPLGGDIVFGSHDSLDNATGTYGLVEFRRRDATFQRYAYFDPTNLQLVLSSSVSAAGKMIVASGSDAGAPAGGKLYGLADGHFYIDSNHSSFGDFVFLTRGVTRMTLKGSAAQLQFADPIDIVLGTSTGTKFGTGSTQKLAFRGLAPVAMPATTGETVGFTAGAGTAVNDASTFTGNVGATAYRISDIVKHLKNQGLIAA